MRRCSDDRSTAAGKLGAADQRGRAGGDLAYRIDTAAMTPDELAHARDLDQTVWSRRWQVLYGMADEWRPVSGEAINADMHDRRQWVPYPRSGRDACGRCTPAASPSGIVSNTGWDVRAVFAEHAMSDFVTSFTLSYEVGAVKPDRQIFDAACASLGARARTRC